MTAQKIPIDIITLPKQKIVEVLQNWLYIDERELVICMEFYFDELNENTTVWEEGKYNYLEYHYRKDVVIGIYKWWNRTTHTWVLEIGIANDTNYQIFYNKESKCDELKIF